MSAGASDAGGTGTRDLVVLPGSLLGEHGPDAGAPGGRLASAARATGKDLLRHGDLAVAGAGAAAIAGDCLCAVAGRVEGIGGVAAALGLPPATPPAKILALGYEAMGDRVVERIFGRFMLALHRRGSGQALLARDQLGARSMHWARSTADRTVFAEDVAELLELLAATPEIDRRATVLWTATCTLPVGASHFEGVARLPPGHLLRLGDGAPAARPYWKPEFRGSMAAPAAELAGVVTAAMDDAVGACLDGGMAGVRLSGGLDSACVAASAVAHAGTPPVMYSSFFPRHPATDESAYIEEIIGTLGVRSVRHIVEGGSALAGALDYVERWRLPTGTPNDFLWNPLFARAADDGVEAMLDGEGGDEVFDVSAHLIADRLARGQVLDAYRLTGQLGTRPEILTRTLRKKLLWRHGVHGVVPPWAHVLANRLRFVDERHPVWLRAKDRRMFSQAREPWRWKRLEGPRWWRHQAYQLTVLRELLDSGAILRRRALLHGVESRHPFLHDLGLVDMALRLPPEPRFDPIGNRVLLRQGMAGRIPDSVRLRRGKPHFAGLLETAFAERDAAVARSLLSDPAARVRALVDGQAMDQRLLGVGAEKFPAGPVAWRAAVWRLASVEIWLRSLDDPGVVPRLRERLGRASIGRVEAAPAARSDALFPTLSRPRVPLTLPRGVNHQEVTDA